MLGQPSPGTHLHSQSGNKVHCSATLPLQHVPPGATQTWQLGEDAIRVFEGEDGRRHPLGCIPAILGVGRRGYAAVMYGLAPGGSPEKQCAGGALLHTDIMCMVTTATLPGWICF